MIEIAPRCPKNLLPDQAFLYCLTLEHNGHKDWRLPTLDEYNKSDKIWGWYHNDVRECLSTTVKLDIFPVRDV